MKAGELFDLPTSLERFAEFFTPEMSPWEWVGNIKKALASVDFSSLDSKSDIPDGVTIRGDVYIHPSVKLPAYAEINGPAWIGANVEMRIGCFIRGSVIIGEGCIKTAFFSTRFRPPTTTMWATPSSATGPTSAPA